MEREGGEVIRYVAGLSGVSSAVARKKSEELLEIVGMKDWAGRKMGSYSKGMKQRIGLAQALVNDPEIVFLDEPTDGVDPSDIMNTLTPHGVEIAGDILTMDENDAEAVQPVIDILRGANITISSMSEARQSLEELFMETVGDHGPGAAMPPKLPRKGNA